MSSKVNWIFLSLTPCLRLDASPKWQLSTRAAKSPALWSISNWAPALPPKTNILPLVYVQCGLASRSHALSIPPRGERAWCIAYNSFSHAIGFCFDERSAALLSSRMRSLIGPRPSDYPHALSACYYFLQAVFLLALGLWSSLPLCFPRACVGLIGPRPSDYPHALSAYRPSFSLRSASGAPCQPDNSVLTHLTHSWLSPFFCFFFLLKG